MQRLWRRYLTSIESYPVVVKSATSGTLMGIGDVLSQLFFGEKDSSIQWSRTAHLFLFGFAVSGPVFHNWYRFMDHAIPGQTTKQVLKKLVIDQLCMAPSIITTFFFAVGLMERKPLPQVYDKWRAEIIPTLQGNYTLWPVATFVGYKYIPQTHRVAYISFVSLFWSIYLSYVAYRKVPATRAIIA